MAKKDERNPLFIDPEKISEHRPEIASAPSREQERRCEREILQAIFDNIPVMILFHDPAAKLLVANREWERVLGWRLEDAQPIEVLNELFPDAESRRVVLEGFRRADRRWTDFRARTRDGRTITTSGAAVALSDGTRLGFGIDVTERRESEGILHQSAEELRALSERLRVVREEERTRMAREVHDEIGQALTALRMDVAWLERRLAAGGGDQRADVESKLRSMSELMATTLDAVQRIATDLRPSVLDELGLEAAIEWCLFEFEHRTGIACTFQSEREKGPLIGPEPSTAIFRILQEALTNVARHSGATRAEIELSDEGENLRLDVRDNGRGIAEDRIGSSASLGLIGMRERARSLGGDLMVGREGGVGTTVTLTIPRHPVDS